MSSRSCILAHLLNLSILAAFGRAVLKILCGKRLRCCSTLRNFGRKAIFAVPCAIMLKISQSNTPRNSLTFRGGDSTVKRRFEPEYQCFQRTTRYRRNQLRRNSLMALLTQLVPASALAKLSEAHITILNSHIEAELLRNDAIKHALTSKAAEHLKSLGH